MPRKSLDTSPTDYPVLAGKVPTRLSLPPARTGLGSAQIMGQGTGPLWGLGQGPIVLNCQYLPFPRSGQDCLPGPALHGLPDTTHMPVFIVSLLLAMFRKSYLHGGFNNGQTSVT